MKRVTINLTDRVDTVLEEAMLISETNKTVTIHKALYVYLLLLRATANKGEIYVRKAPSAPLERIILV